MKDFTSLPDNLKSKINVTPGCWIWTAGCSTDKNGVRRASLGGKQAYRSVWEFLVGPIPEGKFLCHTCDNAKCVNQNIYL